jgi:DNA-binding transcriptional ArsR family regulator
MDNSASEQDVKKYVAEFIGEASSKDVIRKIRYPTPAVSDYTVLPSENAEDVIKVCKALGNSTRLKILFTIYDRGKVFHSDLLFNTYAGGLNPASVKHHMNILCEAGLMKKRGAYKLTELGEKVVEPLVNNFRVSNSIEDYFERVTREMEEKYAGKEVIEKVTI